MPEADPPAATSSTARDNPHAYGFAIEGVAMTDAWRLIDPGEGPTLRVSQIGERHPATRSEIGDDQAVIPWDYGTTVLRRDTMSVEFYAVPPLSDHDIVHPCLWPAAAIAARWVGRETLHGGGFLDAAGGAWLIMGDSGHGKSSLLASLAVAGEQVLADDLVVVEGRHCFAGPRCVDLLAEAADRLGVGDEAILVRASQRRRLALAPIAARVPLHGLVYLAWGQRVGLERLAPAERPARLAEQRRVPHLGVDPVGLLELSLLPAFTLRRPRDWASMDEARRLLVESANAR